MSEQTNPDKLACPRCDGLGRYPYNKHYGGDDATPCLCWRCNGAGGLEPRVEAGARRLESYGLAEAHAITLARLVVEAVDAA